MTYSDRSTDRGFPIIGYTTRRHLILDLDNTTKQGARSIAHMIIKEWPKVGDALILSSSPGLDRIRLVYGKWGRPLLYHDRGNFHLIFDNGIGYNLSCKICQVLAVLNVLNRDYVRIREFRGDMTLRISPSRLYDEDKPIPHIVGWVINELTTRSDRYIEHYLKVKKGVERLFTCLPDAERVPYNRPDHRDRGPVQGPVDPHVQSDADRRADAEDGGHRDYR